MELSNKLQFLLQRFSVIESKQLDYTGGEISITRAKISSNSKVGVLVAGGWLKSLSISDTEISYFKQFGIKLQPIGINFVKISSTNLEQNMVGIHVGLMASTEIKIQNCAINGSQSQGMLIYGDKIKVLHVVNSTVTSSGDRGLKFDCNRSGKMQTSLLISGVTFAWNKMGAVRWFSMFSDTQDTMMQIKSSTFFRNLGPTIEINYWPYGHYGSSWVFLNNRFDENRGLAVIVIVVPSVADRLYMGSTVVVNGNRFLSNQCPDKAVIDIRMARGDFYFRENIFEYNFGGCLLFDATAAETPALITDNVFYENYCKKKSVVVMQVMHGTVSGIQNRHFAFMNNSLLRNSFVNSSRSPARSKSNDLYEETCAVVLSGSLYYKGTSFHLNKFNNSEYRRELCVRVPAYSQRDVVNVTHNWWGTATGSGVRDRISDFDVNYDFAIANDWPFLLQDNDHSLISLKKYDFRQHGDILSGRLFQSLTLKASESPYIVATDFSVLENVTLTIEAGVTIKVTPGVSILVAGGLQVRGTLAKPVILTVKEPTRNDGASHLPVRLVDGQFPWEGRVEVFHGNSW